MKRAELKELLRSAIYETQRGDGGAGEELPPLTFIKDRDGRDVWLPDPIPPTNKEKKNLALARVGRDARGGGPLWDPSLGARAASSARDDLKLGRFMASKSSPSAFSPQFGGSVPPQVQLAASKAAGGKVAFGRYYDAQGNYLGRTQGGQWVDGKSDPNAKTQLEMYNKLMEIESGKYTSKDRELVKEMIREIVKSCS